MLTVIPLLIVMPLLVFYLWMFSDMLRNDYLMSNPWLFFGITSSGFAPANSRYNWMMAFVFLNVIAAALYYFTEYRQR